jgi:hypothetical protein
VKSTEAAANDNTAVITGNIGPASGNNQSQGKTNIRFEQ